MRAVCRFRDVTLYAILSYRNKHAGIFITSATTSQEANEEDDKAQNNDCNGEGLGSFSDPVTVVAELE